MGKGVLFICYGNACRSIMAEAVARHYFRGSLKIASAGIAALGRIPKNTLEALEEISVSCEELYSKNIDEIDVRYFSVIVNLSGVAIDRFIPIAFQGRIVDAYVQDPYGGSPGLFRQARDKIEQIILREFPRWLEEE